MSGIRKSWVREDLRASSDWVGKAKAVAADTYLQELVGVGVGLVGGAGGYNDAGGGVNGEAGRQPAALVHAAGHEAQSAW